MGSYQPVASGQLLSRCKNAMANVQIEKGYTRIANEALEALVKVRLPPSEKDILFFIIRKTYGYGKKEDRISLTQFEKGTELSRPTVVRALSNLLTRKILVKAGLLIGFNKDYESWVVNAGLLVKSKHEFGKGGFTKTSKGGFTHKRKKEITKEIMAKDTPFNPLGGELIKSFEKINPAVKRMYGNTTQRKACDDLIETYGFERVKKVIEGALPRTNGMEYMPSITTPNLLFLKWTQLGQ